MCLGFAQSWTKKKYSSWSVLFAIKYLCIVVALKTSLQRCQFSMYTLFAIETQTNWSSLSHAALYQIEILFQYLFVASIFIVKLRLSAVDIDRELQALNRSCILVMRSLCDSTFLLAKVFCFLLFFLVLNKNLFLTLGIFSCIAKK